MKEKIKPMSVSLKSLILSIKIKKVLREMDNAYEKSLRHVFEKTSQHYKEARSAMLLALLERLDYLGKEGKKALLIYYCDNLKEMSVFEQENYLGTINYLFSSVPGSERLSIALTIIKNADKIRKEYFSKFMDCDVSKIIQISEMDPGFGWS